MGKQASAGRTLSLTVQRSRLDFLNGESPHNKNKDESHNHAGMVDIQRFGLLNFFCGNQPFCVRLLTEAIREALSSWNH